MSGADQPGRLSDAELTSTLVDLTDVPLGELRTLHTPVLVEAIRQVLEKSAQADHHEIQIQAADG